MSALDNLTPRSSYGGVQFFWQTPASGLKRVPRFGSEAAVIERVAPWSDPANVVRQVLNRGMLNDYTITVGITGTNLALLRAKVEQGMQALILAGDTSQQAILTKVVEVGAVTQQGYLYVNCTFRGRP